MEKPNYSRYLNEVAALKNERTRLKAEWRRADAELEATLREMHASIRERLDLYNASLPTRADAQAQTKAGIAANKHARLKQALAAAITARDAYQEMAHAANFPPGQEFEQSRLSELTANVTTVRKALKLLEAKLFDADPNFAERERVNAGIVTLNELIQDYEDNAGDEDDLQNPQYLQHKRELAWLTSRLGEL